MKITKYLSVLVLVLIALLLTGFTYSYWAGEVGSAETIKEFTGQTVQIGTGKTVNTQLIIDALTGNEKVTLVPRSRVEDSAGNATDNFYEIKLSVPVTWSEKDTTSAAGAKGLVTVSDKKVYVNKGAEDYLTTGAKDGQPLFTVSVDDKEINLGESVNIEVTLTFENEPKDKAVYEAVAGKKLILELQLKVGEN